MSRTKVCTSGILTGPGLVPRVDRGGETARQACEEKEPLDAAGWCSRLAVAPAHDGGAVIAVDVRLPEGTAGRDEPAEELAPLLAPRLVVVRAGGGHLFRA